MSLDEALRRAGPGWWGGVGWGGVGWGGVAMDARKDCQYVLIFFSSLVKSEIYWKSGKYLIGSYRQGRAARAGPGTKTRSAA